MNLLEGIESWKYIASWICIGFLTMQILAALLFIGHFKNMAKRQALIDYWVSNGRHVDDGDKDDDAGSHPSYRAVYNARQYAEGGNAHPTRDIR